MFVPLNLPFVLPFSNKESTGEKYHVRSNLFTILLGLYTEGKSFSSHDWPDADSIKILSGIRKAMAPHSRVLVRTSSF